MSKKPIPFPRRAALEKHREKARRPSRVIFLICGRRYALDFWSSICELNPADAVVRPFPSTKLPITPKAASELPCFSSPSGVIHVMTAKRAALRTTTMTTFTIDPDNNIMTHHTPEEAAATAANPFESFSSPQEFAELVKSWPATRLLAIWNSLPGVPPIQKFKDHQAAATRIWKRLGGLAGSVPPQPTQPAKLKSEYHAKGGAPGPIAAPVKSKVSRKATAI